MKSYQEKDHSTGSHNVPRRFLTDRGLLELILELLEELQSYTENNLTTKDDVQEINAKLDNLSTAITAETSELNVIAAELHVLEGNQPEPGALAAIAARISAITSNVEAATAAVAPAPAVVPVDPEPAPVVVEEPAA